MPAKRAGAPVSSWPTSGVLLFSMAATYLVCMSSKVKYSTVTLAPFFWAQRWALASIALLVGSTYVFRIQRRRLVPFFTAGAAGRGKVSRAEVPTAPARSERRLIRLSSMACPPWIVFDPDDALRMSASRAALSSAACSVLRFSHALSLRRGLLPRAGLSGGPRRARRRR